MKKEEPKKVMSREELTAMVRGVQNGDNAALAKMYEVFHDSLFGYIYVLVNKNKDLAADLTQDTFVEIMQSIHSLEEPVAFVTWSRQIAYRRCTAYFKKRHDFLVDEDEDGYSVFDTIEEDRTEFIPDAAMDQEDLRQTLHRIIDDLPEEQRAALMMRYFEERPVTEIAQIQGVSEGTVKSRLNYGRKAMKTAVEDYEKKTGIKLHCVGIVPLLLWLWRQSRCASAQSVITGTTAATAGTAAAATAGTAAAATAGTAATATAGTAATATGTISAKIVAIVLAASVAAGGLGYGVFSLLKNRGATEDTSQNNQTVQEKICEHQWSAESVCELCGQVCPHACVYEEDVSTDEGISSMVYKCEACPWTEEKCSLIPGEEPIYITSHPEFISQYITEKSYERMREIVIDTQNTIWDNSYHPETTKLTVAGTLYYYNEERSTETNLNNRLVVIYRFEDEAAPGCWYTYLSLPYDMVIRCFHDEEGNAYFTTVASSGLLELAPVDHFAHISWECIIENYCMWLPEDYPTSFVHNDVRYVGHLDFNDCMQALYINDAPELENGFDHLYVTGDIQQFITGY